MGAERKLQEWPVLLKTPPGYVQPWPWLAIANKQLELMAKFMSELELSPASRARVSTLPSSGQDYGSSAATQG